MNTAVAALPAKAATRPPNADLAAWIAVVAGTLAAFMAMLDVSIVNAALPVIQGEIGATQSEGTWVGTAYLVAEVVVMPLTAWLERIFGLRRVLFAGAVVFTVFSVMCGFATDLTTMILGRVGQGLAGGVMIPVGMTIMAKRLPPHQQAIGMSLFASAALLGPILGPVVGGWITENYSWHYAFFINVPICAGLVALVFAGLPPEQGDLSEIGRADWFGVAGMVLGLGGLTVLLEEGHREQWFESSLIWKLAITSVVGFVLVAIGQFRAERPIMQLSLLRKGGFAAVIAMMMVNGAILFATVFIVPQFLAAVPGYNALQAGKILSISGMTAICAALLYPIAIARIDIRILVAFGVILVGLGSWINSSLTMDSDGKVFVISQLLLGFGITYNAIPLQQASISAVSVEDAAEATSMFNIARNVGASFGLAWVATLLDQRLEFHRWRLHESIGANNPETGAALHGMAAQLGGSIDASTRMLDAAVMEQALVMSFNDIFTALAYLSLVILPLVLLLPQIDPERATGMAH